MYKIKIVRQTYGITGLKKALFYDFFFTKLLKLT